MANEDAVAMASSQDLAQAAAMPKHKIPEGYEAKDFVTPDLPVAFFSLRKMETGDEFGPFPPESWMTDSETGFTSTHVYDVEGHRHLFVLRVLAESKNGSLHLLHCVEEDGTAVTYLINEMPDTELEEIDF